MLDLQLLCAHDTRDLQLCHPSLLFNWSVSVLALQLACKTSHAKWLAGGMTVHHNRERITLRSSIVGVSLCLCWTAKSSSFSVMLSAPQ